MKESFYFSHDFNARNDPKVLTIRSEFGNEGYALFFYCLETMAEDSMGYIYRVAIGGLSVGYCVAIDTLKKFLDFTIKIGVFVEDEKGIYSKRMLEHKNLRKMLSEKGKEGANKRWNDKKNREANGEANATPIAIKESKGKEIESKVNEIKDLNTDAIKPQQGLIENNPVGFVETQKTQSPPTELNGTKLNQTKLNGTEFNINTEAILPQYDLFGNKLEVIDPKKTSTAEINAEKQLAKEIKRKDTANLEQIQEYAKEKNMILDPIYFFDSMESCGWVLKAGNRVKDWKATMRKWNTNRIEWNKNGNNKQNNGYKTKADKSGDAMDSALKKYEDFQNGRVVEVEVIK